MVYARSSRAICQLEKRVHCNAVKPVGLVLIRLELPGDALLQDVQSAVGLPEHCTLHESRTRQLGIEWCRQGNALGLWVPSAVESHENNIVLNPVHRAFRDIVVTVERDPFEFDPRMF